MVASAVWPAREYSTATVSPALRVSVRLSSWAFEVAAWPSILVMMSPTSIPAWAAGPPGCTARTKSPPGVPAWVAAAGGIGTVWRPK
jgi:hypothetical protein